jgi:hypothetical protein
VLEREQAAAAFALGWVSGRVVATVRLLKHRCRPLINRTATRALPSTAAVVLLVVIVSGCGEGTHVATVSVPDAGSIVINFRMTRSPNADCSGLVTFRAVPVNLGSGAGRSATQIVLANLSGKAISVPDIEGGPNIWVCEIQRSILNLTNGTWSAGVTTPVMVSCTANVRAGESSAVRIWDGRCTP